MATYHLTEADRAKIRKWIREEASRVRNPDSGHRRAYWKRGGKAKCPDRNETHHLTIFGSPTGGTLTFTLTVNGSAEAMTVDWDATAAEVDTELETHTEIAVGDVSVTGGPLPNATIVIEFIVNLAATAIALPVMNWGSLTGGTGVAAIASRPQSGYPG